ALNEAGEQATSSSDASTGEVMTPSAAGPAEGRHTGAGPADPDHPADPRPAPSTEDRHSTSGGVPMMPMMGFGAFGGGGQARRPSKARPVTKSSDLLGEPGLVAPPVIGEDENAQQKKPPAPPAK
ncbi:MAG TPA: endo-1,4-beta-glucanase, partial [Amycolatopsis sp.]|nr:endo-1,4-beta-glucanase [Amycolatopsis sp.]